MRFLCFRRVLRIIFVAVDFDIINLSNFKGLIRIYNKTGQYAIIKRVYLRNLVEQFGDFLDAKLVIIKGIGNEGCLQF